GSVICINLADIVYSAVVLAHKKPWLFVISKLFGSAIAIAFSFIFIPDLKEVGAALALAGGAVANLLMSMVISERLTPVPLPWRSLVVSLGTAMAMGTIAAFVSHSVADAN